MSDNYTGGLGLNQLDFYVFTSPATGAITNAGYLYTPAFTFVLSNGQVTTWDLGMYDHNPVTVPFNTIQMIVGDGSGI